MSSVLLRRLRSVALAGATFAAAGYLLIACGDEAALAPATAEAGTEAGAEADPASTADAEKAARSPAGRRPTSVACGAALRPSGIDDAGADAECSSDDDCVDGAEGRCQLRRRDPELTPSCTYHACSADQDCPGTTSVCGCGVGWAGENLCLTRSNCRTDGDCATGERCVYSDPPILRYFDSVAQGDEVGGVNYTGDAIGYFCTTPQDECNCPHDTSTDKCIYNIESKHWQCAYQP